jgi:hypothetical protein
MIYSKFEDIAFPRTALYHDSTIVLFRGKQNILLSLQQTALFPFLGALLVSDRFLTFVPVAPPCNTLFDKTLWATTR